jgi:uncharacterized protein YecE (DUF72 family)
MLHIGTSGWQYPHWREVFYPKGLAQREWLPWYADRFQTVELNNSFYRLPEAASFERWRQETPDDFIFAVKMSRFLTHIKRLRDPKEPVERFLERATHLGPKLGPVLLQLPPRMTIDADRLEGALACFPKDVRVVVEFRDESWFVDEIKQLLERHRVALCLADSPQRATPAWRTTGWGFVRFHWGLGSPEPCYQESALQRWTRQIAGLWPDPGDVFAYFNNDARGCALGDATGFARLAKIAGLQPTRVPEAIPHE